MGNDEIIAQCVAMEHLINKSLEEEKCLFTEVIYEYMKLFNIIRNRIFLLDTELENFMDLYFGKGFYRYCVKTIESSKKING